MKNRFAAIAAAVVLAPGAAFAAGSHTLDVTASVDGTCSFDLPNSPMDFGAIDPTSLAPATAAATVDFHCSNGTPYTITLGGSSPYTLNGPAGATMQYNASITAGDESGTGTGMAGGALTVGVDGTIAVADFQNATAGAYTGSLVLSILP